MFFLIISVVPITVFSTSATPVSGVSLISFLRTNKPAEMNIMNETSDSRAETAFTHTDAVTKTNMLIKQKKFSETCKKKTRAGLKKKKKKNTG